MMTPPASRAGDTSPWRLAIGLLACAAMASACHRDPNTAKTAYFEAGNRYFAQQKYEEAGIEYRNAVKYDPKFGEARYQLGQVYMRAGDFQNAFREYIRAADLLPDRADVQLMAGRFHLINHHFDEARGRARHLLEHDPKNVGAQILLGNALAGLRDLDGAIAEMQAALEINPTEAGIYTSLGQMQRARGDLKNAESTFTSAIAAAPKSLNARLALGNFYWSVGRLDEAEAAFKEGVNISASDPLANRALATLYLSTNRSSEAEPFVRALASDAKDATGRLRLADYYIGTSRFNDAMTVLVGIVNDDSVRAKAAMRIAAIDYAQGRPEQAFRRLDQVLQTNPNDAQALLVKGRLLLLQDKIEDALVAVKAAVGRDSNAGSAFYTLGTIHARRHDYNEATKAFTEAAKLQPARSDTTIRLAEIALKTGSMERAAQFAAEAVSRSPRDAAARFVLSRALIAKGDLTGAERQVGILVAALPKSATVHALKGALQAIKHDDNGARRSFEQALQFDAGNIDAFGGLVALDGQAGHFAAAAARIDDRLAKRPADAAVLMLSAQIHGAARDFPRVEQSLKKIIETEPANLRAYSMLAQLYIAQNRLDEALAEFDRIGKGHPEAVGARTMSAMILEVQGHADQARERYEAILATHSRSAVAANNLAWYYTERGTNLDMALQLAQTAKTLLPDLAAVNDTLGWIYYKKGLTALAIAPLEQSVGANPNNHAYRYHLGLAYARSGEKAKARAALAEAIRLQPDGREASEAKKALAAL